MPLLAVLAFWGTIGLGVGPSFAQSYNFDFEANGVSATGLFNV
jgi:hypothetical protein